VDSLHVAPFDEPIRPPDDFSRRIARNAHGILQEEAHLTKVIDPAGGSYAVEALTDRLARDAWALFQDVEREGGMADALKIGSIQTRIAAVAEERAANLASQRDVLVGVNRFVNPAGEMPINDNTDYEALYRRRLEQLALHRAVRPAGHEAALADLAETAVVSPEKIVEAAIEAAVVGATLGEIAGTLRPHETTFSYPSGGNFA
jgi:methylmalonyl-CoA mutase